VLAYAVALRGTQAGQPVEQVLRSGTPPESTDLPSTVDFCTPPTRRAARAVLFSRHSNAAEQVSPHIQPERSSAQHIQDTSPAPACQCPYGRVSCFTSGAAHGTSQERYQPQATSRDCRAPGTRGNRKDSKPALGSLKIVE